MSKRIGSCRDVFRRRRSVKCLDPVERPCVCADKLQLRSSARPRSRRAGHIVEIEHYLFDRRVLLRKSIIHEQKEAMRIKFHN